MIVTFERLLQVVDDLIEMNKDNDNVPDCERDEYMYGYVAGYNDALVDLLNNLRIKNDYAYCQD